MSCKMYKTQLFEKIFKNMRLNIYYTQIKEREKFRNTQFYYSTKNMNLSKRNASQKRQRTKQTTQPPTATTKTR